ncbi:hypothetical protein LIER_39786 [Lithospermum erythrorhizon]|uniref:Uncharacterized protein n=1 Tax=Lithospermum erythrorhizon TaxID=34254 RepID=A0AAV3QN62_LITER
MFRYISGEPGIPAGLTILSEESGPARFNNGRFSGDGYAGLGPGRFPGNPARQQHLRPTMLNNGNKMAVSDVTEVQSSSPTTPSMQPHTKSPTGLPMKRSLQRFLKKRKHKAKAASPYLHQLAN